MGNAHEDIRDEFLPSVFTDEVEVFCDPDGCGLKSDSRVLQQRLGKPQAQPGTVVRVDDQEARIALVAIHVEFQFQLAACLHLLAQTDIEEGVLSLEVEGIGPL